MMERKMGCHVSGWGPLAAMRPSSMFAPSRAHPASPSMEQAPTKALRDSGSSMDCIARLPPDDVVAHGPCKDRAFCPHGESGVNTAEKRAAWRRTAWQLSKGVRSMPRGDGAGQGV